jgi:hypothetical protein
MQNDYSLSNNKARAKGCKGCYFVDQLGYCDYLLTMKQRRESKVLPGGGCDKYTTHKPASASGRNRPLILLTAEQRTELSRASKTPNIKSTKLDGVQEAFNMWESGSLDVEIAIRFNVSKNTVVRWRKKHGLTTNYKCGRRNGNEKKV